MKTIKEAAQELYEKFSTYDELFGVEVWEDLKKINNTFIIVYLTERAKEIKSEWPTVYEGYNIIYRTNKTHE